MSSRRTLILLAAIVVGALAAFSIWNYVGGIEDRANDNARRVPVIRIARDIPRGLTGQEALDGGYLQRDEIPVDFLPATAVDDFDIIRTKIAANDFPAGLPLVDGMFVDPVDSQITAARRVPTGNVAITVEVDQVRGVAGLIVPGDFVNILVAPQADLCEDPGGEAPADPAAEEGDQLLFCKPARYLYQAVRVLFVDRSPIPLPGESTGTDGTAAVAANRGLITFAVPPQAAQVIASLEDDNMYFTLLPNDYVPQQLPVFDPFVPVLPGEDPAVLTPYGPEGFDLENTP